MGKSLRYLLMAGALIASAGACAAPAAGRDTVKPQVLSVDVTPVEVTPGQPFVVSAYVTDTVGVSAVGFTVRRNGAPAGFCSTNAILVSGTNKAGTWERTCTAPAVANAGSYQVNTLASDAAGNIRFIGDGPVSGTSGHFTMLGDLVDETAPTVVDLAVTPSPTTRGATITMSARVTDDSGTKGVLFTVRRAGTSISWCSGAATLVSGTAVDGVWERTCVVGAGALSGDYAVNTAVTDLLNNFVVLGDAPPGPTTGNFTVVDAAA